MFGIGGWEFIIVSVLALLLFGPDKLPQFARTLGRFMRDFKRYQAMMESTIRAEVFAAETAQHKDQFEKGKEFREKVAGTTFSQPAPKTAGKSDEATGEEGTSAAEAAPDPEAAETPDPGAGEAADPATEDGKGEPEEA